MNWIGTLRFARPTVVVERLRLSLSTSRMVPASPQNFAQLRIEFGGFQIEPVGVTYRQSDVPTLARELIITGEAK